MAREKTYYGPEVRDHHGKLKIKCVGCDQLISPSGGSKHVQTGQHEAYSMIKEWKDKGFDKVNGFEALEPYDFLPRSPLVQLEKRVTGYRMQMYASPKTDYGHVAPKPVATVITTIMSIAKDDQGQLPATRHDTLRAWYAKVFESEETLRTVLVLHEHLAERQGLRPLRDQMIAFFDLPEFPAIPAAPTKPKASPKRGSMGPLFASAGSP
jgi:hypothetical protein